MLSVTCKECGASFYVPQEAAGKETKCGSCGKMVPVPQPEQTVTEVPAEAVEGAWEYLVVHDRGRMGHVDQAKLNEFGAQGWELVSVYRDNPSGHPSYYFKRPRRT